MISSKIGRYHLAISILAATYGLTSYAQDVPNKPAPAANQLDELVVTGSYIKGTPTDAPSPVTVINRDAFDQEAAATLWDVVKNLKSNYGSTTVEGTDGTNSQSASGSANINLRGLGQNSTLVLFDGKRQASAAQLMFDGSEYVDINALPQIAVDRIEVLSDGGSALYGSDAIAGVVNFVLRRDFKGTELRADVQKLDHDGRNYEKTFSGIHGWASDSGNTHLVFAGEYYEKDPIPITHASTYGTRNVPIAPVVGTGTFINPIAAFHTQANPAYGYPAFNATLPPGSPTFTSGAVADPLCLSQGFLRGTQADTLAVPYRNCYEDMTDSTFLDNGIKRIGTILNLEHEFNPALKFNVMARFTQDKVRRTDFGAVGGLGTQFILPVRNSADNITIGGPVLTPFGSIPIGANGLGSYAATPPTILNAPNSLANGGMNTTGLLTVVTRMPHQRDSEERKNESTTKGLSAGFTGDFSMVGREFSYDTSVGYSSNTRLRQERVLSRSNVELALNGLGGPNCVPNGTPDFNLTQLLGPVAGYQYWTNVLAPSFFGNYAPGFPRGSRANMSLALTSNNQGQGACQFFNPFLTNNLNIAALTKNSDELINWMAPMVPATDKKNELFVFDAVITGDLFSLPGGTAKFAAGVQHRRQRNQSFSYSLVEPGLQYITGYTDRTPTGVPNAWEYGSDDTSLGAYYSRSFDDTRRVNSIFTELSLPVAEKVETQLAVRYESYNDIGSAISPKLAASWRPINDLLLRGSFSKSFRAPNTGLVYNGTNSGSSVTQDVLSAQRVRAGQIAPTDANAEREDLFYTGVGSPNIGPEYATTYSAGFIWTPSWDLLDGSSVQVDYWRFEYRDRIVPQSFQQLLVAETEAFQRAVADPSKYVTYDSLSDSATIPFVPCNPTALTGAARDGCVVDPREYAISGIYRANQGDLINLFRGSVNAGSIITDGIDVRLGYPWKTFIGNFRVGVDYTWLHEYVIHDVPGFDRGLADTGETNAAGTTGGSELVRAMPDHKGSLALSWWKDNHSANAIARFIGAYKNLNYYAQASTQNPLIAGAVISTIDSYYTVDLSYGYMMPLGNTELRLDAAILDVFERDIPYIYIPASTVGYDPTVYDARGRRFKLTATLKF